MGERYYPPISSIRSKRRVHIGSQWMPRRTWVSLMACSSADHTTWTVRAVSRSRTVLVEGDGQRMRMPEMELFTGYVEVSR